jgi:hypothetical protein
MNRCLLLTVILVVTLPRVSNAQVAPQRPDLASAVSALARSSAALSENLRSPQLQDAVQWLQNNVAKTNPENVSPEYVRSLERAASVLSGKPNAAAVDDVTRELEAKVQHCRSLGVGMGGSVALRVNTRRAGQVVSDWQVLYLLKFDDWLRTPPRNFPRVSSPTEMTVEPGRYWVWGRDPSTGRTGERVLVEVAGRKELALDLPVP